MYWKMRQLSILNFYKRSYYQLLMGVKVEGEFTQTLKNQGARG